MARARLLVPFAALWLLLPLAPLRALAAEQGLLWRMRQGAGTVYLAGSIHVLPAGATLPPSYLRAYDEAEGLMMEVDLTTLETPEGLGAFIGEVMVRALLPPDRSLRTVLGPERWTRLVAALRPMGLPEEGLDRFEPWMASMILTSMAMQQGGFEAESGVEGQLLRRASADGKLIDPLETLAQQLDLFDGLPEPEQVAMLDQGLAESAPLGGSIAELETAWRRGMRRRCSSCSAVRCPRAPRPAAAYSANGTRPGSRGLRPASGDPTTRWWWWGPCTCWGRTGWWRCCGSGGWWWSASRRAPEHRTAGGVCPHHGASAQGGAPRRWQIPPHPHPGRAVPAAGPRG